MPRAWIAAAPQGLCGLKQKASKKCSIPNGARIIHPITQSPFQAPNHLSRHQCTRRIILQYAPAKGCSTGGHFLPLRNQRHTEVGRPLDSVSTGLVEYAGTPLHTCQLEDLRVTSTPCPPAPVQVHYNKVQPSHLWGIVLLCNVGFYQSKGRINSINSCT